MSAPLIEVEDLNVTFDIPNGTVEAVRGVSFSLHRGECLAIVGESGSGKTVTARSLLDLVDDSANVRAKKIEILGEDVTRYSQKQWRRLRGRSVGLVLQDALVSLDPLRRVDSEIGEAIREHRLIPRKEIGARVVQLLESVGVPEPEARAKQYPHQLSGGLRQRALIASALSADPKILIADEPTTALDVTVQMQILRLLAEMKSNGMAMMLISHDLAVVANFADQIAVMNNGVFVEVGPARQVLEDPQDAYTQQLLKAIPTGSSKGKRLSPLPPVTVDEAWKAEAVEHTGPMVSVQNVNKSFRLPNGEWLQAVQDASFDVAVGETLGIVGESGSGKSTVARMIMGMEEPDSGEISFIGTKWSGITEAERRPRRTQLQSIYQDPLSSFDPRWTTGQTIGEALEAAGEPKHTWRARSAELLEQVGLAARLLDRRPLELSGGQRQRVAIARALAPRPRVLVCDEPVSALDVSVQAQVLDLLNDLQSQLGLTMLFISHDLGVVEHIADRVLVMRTGEIVESGGAHEVFLNPQHEYTQKLIASLPGRVLQDLSN